MNTELMNKMIMNEIGLDVGPENFIIDQDYNQPLMLNGKGFKYISDYNRMRTERNTILFNPCDDVKVMTHLFAYYLNKKGQEDGIYFPIYFPISGTDNRSALETKSNSRVYRSKYYKSESLKYLDVIMQINGEDNVDLTYLDE